MNKQTLKKVLAIGAVAMASTFAAKLMGRKAIDNAINSHGLRTIYHPFKRLIPLFSLF